MTNGQVLMIIKAPDARSAKQFARNHKIQVKDLCPGDLRSIRARTDPANIVKVQKWFLEPGCALPGIGYPDGTLLYFNIEA